MKWSDSARTERDNYLKRVIEALRESEADPAEVTADLTAHFEATAHEEGLALITHHDLRRYIAHLGPADDLAGIQGAREGEISAPSSNGEPPRQRGSRHIIALIFGVLIPAASYVVEVLFRGCSDLFFDPMPSIWHHGGVLAIIGVNAVNWRNVCANRLPKPYEEWGNQAVIILSLYFALIFLPILPMAAIGLVGIIYFGIGLLALLPMSPYFTLLTAVVWQNRWNGLRDGLTPRPRRWGYAIGFVCLFLMIGPYIVYHQGMAMAVSDSPAVQSRGIRLLRNFGNKDVLLRSCYSDIGSFQNRDLLTDFLLDIPTDQKREIFYRVTGEPFNRELPRQRVLGRGPVADLWDADVGGARVGGQRKKVDLVASRVDGSLDADAGLGYIEWTLEFRNRSFRQEEARGVIQLPAGGVASRLTLWINGEEREAAFGGRSQVREAYERVVSRRRDPVLVTTAGPDQLMFQCFPIPPDGGTMKFRIGITLPIESTDLTAGRFTFPWLVERNFQVADDQTHSVWLQSEHAARDAYGLLLPAGKTDGPRSVFGEIPHDVLQQQPLAVTVERNPRVHAVVAQDYVNPSSVVRAELTERIRAVTGRIALVVDGSKAMAPYRDELMVFAEAWSDDPERRVFIAHDDVLDAPDSGEWPRFEGGIGNSRALVAAWDWAGRHENGIIAWIHGPQPVSLFGTEPLRQRMERHQGGPSIHHLAVERGPNRIVESFTPADPIERIFRVGSPVESLAAFLDALAEPRFVWTYARLDADVDSLVTGNPTKRTSDHLVRLWQFKRILDRLRNDPRSAATVTEDAVRYMLVTPVSGAVVLETQAQYERAGLDDIDASLAPVHIVPEPNTILLLLLGSSILLGAVRAARRYRGWA